MDSLKLMVSDLGEIELLKKVFLPDVSFADSSSQNDDCAHLNIGDNRLLLSIDPCPTPVAHWFKKATGDVWGHYTAVINLSDIAASGGKPFGMLVSLEMPDDTLVSFLQDFQSGLMSALKKANVVLLGGNVKSSSKFSATGTIIGYAGKNVITRKLSGNSESSLVYLIGSSGRFWSSVLGHYYGWGSISVEKQKMLDKALCFPEAQVNAGMVLGKLPFNIACMDCSDGLANALFQLSQINDLDIVVNYDFNSAVDVEISKIFRKNKVDIENAYYGFGDWQLVCLVSYNNGEEFEELMKDFSVTKLGVAIKGSGIVVKPDGRKLNMSALNQNFAQGYNSINTVDDLIKRFMKQPVFL